MAGTGAGGGETADSPSGFTVDTLHAHINAVLMERDRRYEQRFLAQEHAVDVALSQVRADQSRSDAATDRRLEQMNEFRGQLTDQAATFMPRSESLQRHEQNADKLADLDRRTREDLARINSRLDLAAGAGAGQDKVRALIAWGIAALLGLISIVVAANAYIGK